MSRARRVPRTAIDRAIAALLGLVVMGSALAIGTVHLPVLLVVGLLAVASAVLSLAEGAARPSGPVIVLLALSAYTLLQALPLPMNWLGFLAPHNAEVWRRALFPFHEHGPVWASLSLDPGASSVEALKWLVYAAVFTTAAFVSSRRGATYGIAVVFATGAVVALATVAHGLVGARRVFGLYQPHFTPAPWHVGPLLNPNNLAGYLNLAALSGLGLMLSRRVIAPTWAIGLGVAMIIGVDVTSASRGAVALLPFGICLFALLLRGSVLSDKRGNRPTRAVAWLLGTAVGGGLLLALLGGTAATWRELYDKSVDKILLLDWAKSMITAHPIFGIGRGAFESVFSAYRTEPGHRIYQYAENFPVQWVAEWGLPVGVAALGSLAWFFRPGVLGARRSVVAAGAWVGIAILALQNLADVAFEVPGVMIALAATLGSLWGDASRRGLPKVDISATSAKSRWPHAFAAFGVGAIVLAACFGRHSVGQDRADVFDRYAGGAGAKSPAKLAALRGELHAAMLRHPAEPYFSIIGALAASVAHDQNPLPWLGRALERGRTNGATHLLLAQVLARRGHRGQALLELRLAVRHDPTLTRSAASLATHWTHDYPSLLRAVPPGKPGASMLEALGSSLSASADREVRWRLLTDALTREPQLSRARAEIGFDLISDLEAGRKSFRCGGKRRSECIARVEQNARILARETPHNSSAVRLRARLLLLSGRPRAAYNLLVAGCPSVKDRSTCLLTCLQAAILTKSPSDISSAASQYLASRCDTAERCATAAGLVGNLLASHGEPGEALTYYARAAREAPTEERWLLVARTASRIGAHAQALGALRRAAKAGNGASRELEQQIEQERQAVLAGEFRK